MTKAAKEADATSADLIQQWRDTDDFIKSERKRFAEHIQPHVERLQNIQTQLHARLIEQKIDSFRAKGIGTAYLSEPMSVEVENFAVALQYAIQNWDKIGSTMVKISPLVDPLRAYMTEHDNKPPPGIKISYPIKVCNIRRS